MSSLKGIRVGRESLWRQRWDAGGCSGSSGWTGAMTSSVAPAALPAPTIAADCSGWASYHGAGDKARKAPSQEGGHPGTGRSPAQPPGGSNLAGRCAAGEQAPQRGGAQAAHGDLGEIPHSLCGSVIHFALPLTRPTSHEARHRSVTAGVSPTAPGCRKQPPTPTSVGGSVGALERPPSPRGEKALLPANS